MKADAEVTRQRRWQRAMRAEGRCERCGQTSEEGTVLCRPCRERAARKRGSAATWQPGDPGRRPLLAGPLLPPGVGTCVRQLRAERGWTLAEMGRACGVSGCTILAIESGKSQGPTWRLLKALAAGLALPLPALVTRLAEAEA